MSKREQRIELIMKIQNNLNHPSLGLNKSKTEGTYTSEEIGEVFDDLKKILALDGVHGIASDTKVKSAEIK